MNIKDAKDIFQRKYYKEFSKNPSYFDLAVHLDEFDELKDLKAEFLLPKPPLGAPTDCKTIYLCGNSLGLQPKATRDLVNDQLDKWETQAVEGHFHEPSPWLTIDNTVVGSMAKLVGALESEVAIMNSLTANLHFMMASFYRPTPNKFKILIEGKAFPSDIYAIVSQIQHHGYNPEDSLIEIYPKDGEVYLNEDDIIKTIVENSDSIALVLLSGIQYYTGQYFDIQRITSVARNAGCVVGFDLAHAVGNVPLSLHDWGCDFACWCTYKYMNSGPGSVGGCFVHERHGGGLDETGIENQSRYTEVSPPRLSGWWGHRLEDRFLMGPKFIPCKGAYGFRVSNSTPLLIACVKASLDLFDKAGMDRLRRKSILLTGFLEMLLVEKLPTEVTIFTPSDPQKRGAQLSLTFTGDASIDDIMKHLKCNGVICDSRKPNVIRIAPCPLYNSFLDVYEFVRILQSYYTKSTAELW